jgi:two-component system CheB/CheR fusion protein
MVVGCYDAARLAELRVTGTLMRVSSMVQVTKIAQTQETMRSMNEALVLGSIRQHELTEAAETLNAKLQQEIAERKQVEAALRESEDRYRNLFNSIDEGFCVIEKVKGSAGEPPDFLYLEANPAFMAQSGMSGMIGKTIRQALPDEPEGWCSIYDTVLRTGEPIKFERGLVTHGRVLELYAFRLEDETHRRVAVIFKDITGRKQAEEANARLAAIVESSDDAIVSKDLNGVITSWNAGSERLFGYTAQEAIGRSVVMLIPRERLDEEPDILQRIRRGERVENYETVRCHKDGTLLDVSLTISPIVDGHGKVVGASKIARNITERKEGEERRRLLMNELAHRGKNLLAVVHSIAFRTMSGTRSLAEARDVLASRIQALARSQSVLMADGFEYASLSEIVRLELEAFSDQVNFDGPDVMLNPKTAQTFALLIHELATNATKYGALSRPDGRVSIQWKVEELEFRFQWRERGGPLVKPPTREGFGRMLIEKVVAQSFDAQPKVSFPAEGFTYEICAPLAVVTADRARTKEFMSETA